MPINPALLPPAQPPSPLLPPGMLPPQPMGPGLGFQMWAQDPQNAMKVQHSMSAADAPLQPNAQMASAAPPSMPSNGTAQPPAPASALVPPAPQPMASAAPPQSALQAAQAEQQRLNATGSGVSQIQNPRLRGLARVGDIVGAMVLGRGEAMIPGTTAHHRQDQRDQAGIIEGLQSQQQAQAALEDTQSQTGLRQAQAAKASAQGDSMEPVTLTAEQAAAAGHPELTGQLMHPKTLSLLMAGKQKGDYTLQNTGANNDTKKSIADNNNDTQKSISDARNARMAENAAAANKTHLIMQGMRDSTSRANKADTIANSAGGVAGKPNKVPADVTKRAALASNVLENADATEKLLAKRPDIIGAGGGRYTNVQQMIGSDDPDINALGVRIHNIALASNGAHGLRSAEAVAKTENDLFNNFKTGPHGIKAGLDATRGSVQTFLDDEKSFQTTGTRTGGGNMTPPTQPTHTFNPKTGKIEAVSR